MVEHGFEEITEFPLRYGGKKLILLKVPKEFDVSQLDGIEITNQKLQTFTANKQNFRITRSTHENFAMKTLRPIVEDDIIAGAGVGNEFEECISIDQYFPVPVAVDQTIIQSYGCVEQMPGLKVRFMPRGSLTDVREVWEKQKSNAASKRLRESMAASNAVERVEGRSSRTSQDLQEVSKQERKAKKSKKSKKESET